MHDTLEELIEIAQDRQQWRQLVETLASKNRHNTQKANTVAKTTALIEALPANTMPAYTDGGCDGNGARGKWGVPQATLGS